LRGRVDCTLAELANKPDGAWVTVGGIVADCKKIRTKTGSQMMFATLDDIEGQVEMLVFKADEAESAMAIAADAVVLVRGRIDHKDRGETKLVVQEAERFEPDESEINRASGGPPGGGGSGPVKFTVTAAALKRPGLIDQLKEVFEHHRGEADVHLAIDNGDGNHTEIKLGNGYRVRPSNTLRAELGNVLGADSLAA
jgi:DNA polymerase-3 subunit alpha